MFQVQKTREKTPKKITGNLLGEGILGLSTESGISVSGSNGVSYQRSSIPAPVYLKKETVSVFELPHPVSPLVKFTRRFPIHE